MRATPSADKKPLLGERWHREAMAERGLIAKHNDSSPLSVAYGDSRPRAPSLALRAIHLVPPRGAYLHTIHFFHHRKEF